MNQNISKEALEYLVGVGKEVETAKAQPIVMEIKGETYVFYDGSYTRFDEMDQKPAPSVFTAYTLDGLIEWIKQDVNGFFSGEERCIVSVVSPTKVVVMTPCKGVNNKAQMLAQCEYLPPRIRFDTYLDSEDFGIMIQTSFMDDENQRIVLQIARNLVEEQSEQTADDGISQRITIKQGIQAVDSAIFKNPAYLRPLRTFTEVCQPCSPFVVRFKEGKQAALFEADGGKWKVEAVQNIGAYLSMRLSEQNVVIIA